MSRRRAAFGRESKRLGNGSASRSQSRTAPHWRACRVEGVRTSRPAPARNLHGLTAALAAPLAGAILSHGAIEPRGTVRARADRRPRPQG
jgi:hypothetical protein